MTIVTRGQGLTAQVDPARGAKIVSLIDATGTEWLAQGASSAEVSAEASFVDAEMAGWDECAPSIVACTVAGWSIPDHGDLWNTPFGVEGSTLRAAGRSLAYDFERTIAPTDDGLLLSYRAETTGAAIPFLWAAHPQFFAPPGTRVELPADVTTVIDVQHEALPAHPWAPDLASIDSVPPGGTRKWYVHPSQSVRTARLVRGDGPALTMHWSASCPYLGVWFDHAAYSREPVIAIEPSTGYFDSLATAVREDKVSVLEPHRPLSWWVRLTATEARS